MSNIIDEKQKLLIEFVISNKELFIKVVGVLSPDYFESPLDNVMKFILDYFNSYNDLPSNDIIKADTTIDFKKRNITDAEFDYITDEVETHCRQMAMRLAIIDAVENHLDNEEFNEIEEKVRKALTVSVDKSLGLSLFDDPKTRLIMMQQNIDSRSIGWPTVDLMIDGIRRGELVVFAAGTGGLKSICLANVGNNLSKDGLHVLYISLELQDDLIAKRMDSIVTGITNKEIFDNIDDVVNGLKDVEKNYGSYYIKKMPVESNAIDIRNYLLEYHLQFGYYPDVMCVDFLDLMSANSRIEGGRFEIDKAIAEQLREIFIDYNVYGFSASQLNRDAVDVQVKSQAHIAGGISKANTADALIAISRTQEQIDSGEMELQILKVRNSEMVTHPTTLYFDSKNLRITEKQASSKIISLKNNSGQYSNDSDIISNKDKLKDLLNRNKK